VRTSALALSCLMLACTVHRTDYVYVRLADPEPQATQLGNPPVEGYRGDPVLLSYRYRHTTGDIDVALDREPFVPSLRISAAVPIEVQAGACAIVIAPSATEVAVRWNYRRPPSESCISVGDPVEVVLSFIGSEEALVLAGSIQQAGTFSYRDSL